MTDQEIIEGLIARDNHVTEDFFFVKCKPLFYSIMKIVYNYEVDYTEMVGELYLYLMEDDAARLRNFGYRCSVYQWLKILAIRFFIKKRNRMIENSSHSSLYDMKEQISSQDSSPASNLDLERLFQAMPTKRYVQVIRRLILEDCDPEELALEMNITTANLYNIKRRAMAQLTRIALNDIKAYGK